MNVLHLTRDLSPRDNGGMSTAVGVLVNAMRAHPSVGRCDVLSFDGFRPARQGTGCPPVVTPGDGGDVVRVSAADQVDAARSLLLGSRFDVVACHDPLLFSLAHDLASAQRARSTFTLHVAHWLQDRLREVVSPTRSAKAERVAVDAADVVFAPSSWLRERASSAFERRVHLVPNIVQMLDEAPLRDASSVRRVIVSGRFGDMKGTDLVAELANRLARLDTTLGFELVGGLPDNARAERRWRKRVSDAAPSVRLRGWLSAHAARAEVAKSDVCIVPSRLETFGLVAAESLAAGTPVVCFADTAVAELVHRPIYGRAVTAGDVEAMALAAHELAGLANAHELRRVRAREFRERLPRPAAVVSAFLDAIEP